MTDDTGTPSPAQAAQAAMGTKAEAHAKLLETARAYRGTILSETLLSPDEEREKIKEQDRLRALLVDAALIWLWHEDNAPC